VAEFATFMGHKHDEVAEYLARYLPEPDDADPSAVDGADGERG